MNKLPTAASIVKQPARDSGKRATKRRCNSFRSREQEKGKDGLSDPVLSSRFFFSSYMFFSSRPSCPFTIYFLVTLGGRV
jgi:hypothetical protein